jgi:hypothetical protein
MLENNKDSYDAHCTVYYTLTDNGSYLGTKVLIVKTIDTAKSNDAFAGPDEGSPPQEGCSWQALLVNTTELEFRSEKPMEGVYKPSPIW